MTTVSDEQVAEAATRLGVVVTDEIFVGGQKRVLGAERGDERLVLKVLATSQVDPSAIKRAAREVELLTSLDSDHLVTMKSGLVLLGSPVDGAAWLEEYISGTDLYDLLVGELWDWPRTASMMREIALGLDQPHTLGVIHRDLSPRNVRRSDEGDWVVLDFGFARHTLRSGLTVAGHPGTLGHLSPEHVNAVAGGPIPSSDVFAIGILGFLCLSGTLPIRGTQDDDYLTLLMRCESDDLRVLRPGLPDRAYEVIEKCLNPQPARRFRNAGALARELESP